MSKVSINPKNHTGRDGDEFVGMRFTSKVDGRNPSVEAIFPLGYHCQVKENQDDLKKELYALLCAIKRHSENKDGDLDITKARSEKNIFPFDAYIAVIRDFMQYGYYIESEVKYKRAPLGKINWKRTIAQVRPTIQDDSYPVYTDFVIRQSAKKTDNMISLIHEWCVYEAFTTLGWLFTTFDPRKSALKIGEDKNYFISVIHDALKSTFNDRNKMLFNAMIAMLRYGGAGVKEPFFYGTTHYHTVWEKLVDTSYGVLPKSEKEGFFPEAKWKFVPIVNDRLTSAGNIFPDTIMCPNGYSGDVFVLDAKYYSFIEDKKNVPLAADIAKQVVYGKYAADKIKPLLGCVYNAFLIPYDFKNDPYKLRTKADEYDYDEEYIYIGFSFIKGQNEKSYERVLGILVDTKWLMENAGQFGKKCLADFIVESYKEAKSYNNEAE